MVTNRVIMGYRMTYFNFQRVTGNHLMLKMGFYPKRIRVAASVRWLSLRCSYRVSVTAHPPHALPMDAAGASRRNYSSLKGKPVSHACERHWVLCCCFNAHPHLPPPSPPPVSELSAIWNHGPAALANSLDMLRCDAGQRPPLIRNLRATSPAWFHHHQ